MTTLTGTYYNGYLKLERPFKTRKPVKVTITFDEDFKEGLEISDFSFLETQELLKDYKGSFADEVIGERRKSL